MLRTKLLPRAQRSRSLIAGFTMVEVMISAGLASFILAGVLTSFVFIGRSGYNAASYSTMEAEARRALETFSEETRMASNLTWNSASSVTLTVVTSGSSYRVTYAYDSSTSGATAQCFYRMLGTTSSTSPKLVLVHNVTDFAYRRYKVVNGVDYSATNDLETKQLQITLRAVRTGATTVAATNAVLSARVVLRNKSVST